MCFWSATDYLQLFLEHAMMLIAWHISSSNQIFTSYESTCYQTHIFILFFCSDKSKTNENVGIDSNLINSLLPSYMIEPTFLHVINYRCKGMVFRAFSIQYISSRNPDSKFSPWLELNSSDTQNAASNSPPITSAFCESTEIFLGQLQLTATVLNCLATYRMNSVC